MRQTAQTILITGANRGLGLELTRRFSREGWRVLACCRQPQEAKELQPLAEAGGTKVMRLDVTDPAQIEELRGALEGEAIDILFNNAGVHGFGEQGFGGVDVGGWLETFRVNTVAPLKLTEALLGNLQSGQRRIVAAMGSLLGSIADNESGGQYAYRSSKAALHMVMKGLSRDLKDLGITAVALHPGWVRTRLGGPKAPLSAEQSAAGLYRVLTGLTAADSGKLLSYRGETLPW